MEMSGPGREKLQDAAAEGAILALSTTPSSPTNAWRDLKYRLIRARIGAWCSRRSARKSARHRPDFISARIGHAQRSRRWLESLRLRPPPAPHAPYPNDP